MNDKEILEKVKEYLELDTVNKERHEICLYVNQLLFWIKTWEQSNE